MESEERPAIPIRITACSPASNRGDHPRQDERVSGKRGHPDGDAALAVGDEGVASPITPEFIRLMARIPGTKTSMNETSCA